MGFINISLKDYDQFLIIAASINQNELANPLKRRLNNLVLPLESPAFPDFNQPKVFGIGLSRTGTTSLYNALERLGYNSLHWLNHDTADLISQPDFFLYDSFTDTSVSHQFEWLYHTFPNSKFILTKRDFNSWHKSIARHYALKRNISGASKLATSSNRHMYQGRVNLTEQNLYAQHDTWKSAFDAFNRRVEYFFKDKPKDRLLTLNMPDGDGWSALCRYLDKPVPDEDFPTSNKAIIPDPA